MISYYTTVTYLCYDNHIALLSHRGRAWRRGSLNPAMMQSWANRSTTGSTYTGHETISERFKEKTRHHAQDPRNIWQVLCPDFAKSTEVQCTLRSNQRSQGERACVLGDILCRCHKILGTPWNWGPRVPNFIMIIGTPSRNYGPHRNACAHDYLKRVPLNGLPTSYTQLALIAIKKVITFTAPCIHRLLRAYFIRGWLTTVCSFIS